MTSTKPDPGRFRRWYSTLHPSLQLIGLQLWLPLFFIVGFCLCYIAAFHAPHPHDVPIAVVGSSSELQQALDEADPGVFVVRGETTVEEAREAVRTGHAAVAWDPAGSTIYKASAHQYQVSALIPAMLTPVLEAGGATPVVQDLAPLPAYDEYGTVSLYLMLAWCIGGYMVAMFIGLMGAPLRHRTRVSVIVVGALLISLITNTLAGPVIGAVQGHYGELVLLGWAWITAIGLTVNGISYFAGRFVALPAMIVFVFLSMPASGGAYPSWFMPQPFAWLNTVVVGSGITEMLKRVLYDVGPGYGRGLTMLVSYAVAGVVLMIVGKAWWERRRIRRIVTGRTTMFADAQAANRDFLISERDDVLARHGLVATDTGSIDTVPEDERRRYEAGADDGSDVDGDVHGDMFLGAPGGLEDTGLDTRPVRVVPRRDDADGR
ncbi:ABC transporter permease [Frigoribacterium sp. PhB116]|uniref:ABC transporter permease n=1 Tax=Frigoribacterium sp. PhB116 TaxID=2485174 RepID=UPI00105D249C|nr:ABC transporter permease [Frigoribacterium sp. PhB116]TDT64700.1 ABC-type multidrug transport system permease subunit [Frigoribacterium sp. PhB116]